MEKSVANFPPDDELALYRGNPQWQLSVIRNRRRYRKTEMERWETVQAA
jgi:hypothetical protein